MATIAIHDLPLRDVMRCIVNCNASIVDPPPPSCCNPDVLRKERSLQRGVAWTVLQRRLSAIVNPRLQFPPVAPAT
jgi:hypothetical protein